MTDLKLYIFGPQTFQEALKSSASHVASNFVFLTREVPFSFYEEPSALLWVDSSEPETFKENLIESLRGVPNTEIVLGNEDKLLSWILERWPQKLKEDAQNTAQKPLVIPHFPNDAEDHTAIISPTKEKSPQVPLSAVDAMVPNDFHEPGDLTTFLIGPPGEYDDFIVALARRGVSCEVGHVPLDRAQVESADQIFVWIAESTKENYQRIAHLLKDRMGKTVILVYSESWEKDLANHFGDKSSFSYKRKEEISKPPAPQKTETGTQAGNQKSVREEEIQSAVQNYISLLKEFVSYNLQRIPFDQNVDPESVMGGLVGQINRWSKMVLSYRKGPDQFKPWKARPCPAEGANPVAWEGLQNATLAQSEFVLTVLQERKNCFEKISASDIVQKQVFEWEGIENAANDYLLRRRYQEILRSLIDKKDLPQGDVELESGMFKGMFKTKKSKILEEAEEAIRALSDQEMKLWRSVVAAEFEALDKDLIERFWAFYEEAAVYWTLNPKVPFAQDLKRRFLRTGFLGRETSGLKTEHLDRMKDVVLENSLEFTFVDGESHALYFDEFLDLVSQQKVAPSYDEDIELNGRGSPEWKAGRRLRKIASQKSERLVTNCQIKKCEENILDLKQKMATYSLEMKTAEANRDRRKLKESKEHHHQTKVVMGRFKSFSEKMRREQGKIKTPSQVVFDPKFPLDFWIRKEVKHLRAKTRLMNRLKDQHFPNDLKEELKNPVVKPTTPQMMKDHIADILGRDISLCDRVLVSHKKRSNALIACVPPLVIVVPGGGGDGVCLEPASDSNEGRVMIPTFSRGPEGIREFLINSLSDYRWDTSMGTAGAEWITSDTLVGAYSRCRWEYRNKDKHIREKCLVYKEETDKKNFRRHYRLFEKSAEEGGKMLFFKSRIIYENLIYYFVLPEGVERLDRS